MKTPYIYKLVDPRDGRIKYVGMTTNIAARRSSHLNAFGRGERRKKWIYELLAIGLMPQMEVVEECTPGNWVEREKHWIKTLREQGEPLTNLTPGGDTSPPDSESEREWRSRMMLGHETKQETRNKIRERLKGHSVSEQTKEKIRAATARQFSNPAAREAARQKTLQQFSDEAARQKQRDAQKRQFSNPEKRERHRQALLKWYAEMTPGKREQIRQANSAKSKLRWERVRERG